MKALYWNPKAEYREEDAGRDRRTADLLDDLERRYRRMHPVPPRYPVAKISPDAVEHTHLVEGTDRRLALR